MVATAINTQTKQDLLAGKVMEEGYKLEENFHPSIMSAALYVLYLTFA